MSMSLDTLPYLAPDFPSDTLPPAHVTHQRPQRAHVHFSIYSFVSFFLLFRILRLCFLLYIFFRVPLSPSPPCPRVCLLLYIFFWRPSSSSSSESFASFSSSFTHSSKGFGEKTQIMANCGLRHDEVPHFLFFKNGSPSRGETRGNC